MRPLRFALTSALLLAPLAAHAADPAALRKQVDASFDAQWSDLQALYQDIHKNPEVAFQENRTAALLAKRLKALGFEVTEHVGKTGVVGVFRNGPGPVVMLRTELDALPMEEKTGLPYASHAQQTVDGKLTFVDHACGHDSHMAWWIGTAKALVAMKAQWHGTLVMVGQPAEEVVSGAKAMLDDGLYTRFPKPDFAFAAHIGSAPTGEVTVKQGATTSASDSIVITFHGQGAHGSMPDKSIDPIVMGARFVEDVQTVISRQKDPQKFGVVTVGSFHAGTVGNIIPDTAQLALSLRSYEPGVRKLLVDGVGDTARAVAQMSHAPAPDVVRIHGTAPVINDPALAARAAGMLEQALGKDHVTLVPATEPGWTASEDFSEYTAAGVAQTTFFSVGGYDPAVLARYKAEGKPVPVNHSPFFAPDPQPSIRTGMEVLTLAVLMVAGS
ncbi:amidohydrolase [Novosphingobium terrae]|uniref:amidohydrolase n=1 Tax=Novosphingobium terrae TaxID=2726189 RepID=UPI001981E5F2|nr:amidohydrolase [Novosphingobium terrae]